ncbi:MAG TPA: TIR domain-containing protein [Pyrinomonadaceae bacterium]|jgi:hypothetical protein
MKIFISWSGERSRAVAKALNDWLPKVIQAVKPFYSPEIEKGAKWSNEIDGELDGTSFGIICLTPDNLESKWIHFESGALSKTPNAKIWTYLHGIKNEDVPPPLSKFQHTIAEKSETLSLVKSINLALREVGGEPLNENFLETMFETFWASLEEKLKETETLSGKNPKNAAMLSEFHRDERDILGEILEIVRNQQIQLDRLNSKFAVSGLPSIAEESKPTFAIIDFTRKLSIDERVEVVNALKEFNPVYIRSEIVEGKEERFYLQIVVINTATTRRIRNTLIHRLPISISESIQNIRITTV